MIMQIEPEEQTAYIEMVARQLTSKFITPITKLCNRKNYFTHAGILAEILEWSVEFFDRYHEELENCSEATDVEEAVMAFGEGKFYNLCMFPNDIDHYFISRNFLLSYTRVITSALLSRAVYMLYRHAGARSARV